MAPFRLRVGLGGARAQFLRTPAIARQPAYYGTWRRLWSTRRPQIRRTPRGRAEIYAEATCAMCAAAMESCEGIARRRAVCQALLGVFVRHRLITMTRGTTADGARKVAGVS